MPAEILPFYSPMNQANEQQRLSIAQERFQQYQQNSAQRQQIADEKMQLSQQLAAGKQQLDEARVQAEQALNPLRQTQIHMSLFESAQRMIHAEGVYNHNQSMWPVEKQEKEEATKAHIATQKHLASEDYSKGLANFLDMKKADIEEAGNRFNTDMQLGPGSGQTLSGSQIESIHKIQKAHEDQAFFNAKVADLPERQKLPMINDLLQNGVITQAQAARMATAPPGTLDLIAQNNLGPQDLAAFEESKAKLAKATPKDLPLLKAVQDQYSQLQKKALDIASMKENNQQALPLPRKEDGSVDTAAMKDKVIYKDVDGTMGRWVADQKQFAKPDDKRYLPPAGPRDSVGSRPQP